MGNERDKELNRLFKPLDGLSPPDIWPRIAALDNSTSLRRRRRLRVTVSAAVLALIGAIGFGTLTLFENDTERVEVIGPKDDPETTSSVVVTSTTVAPLEVDPPEQNNDSDQQPSIGELRVITQGDGSTVTELELFDGTKVVIFLPAILGNDFEATVFKSVSNPFGQAIAELSGDSFEAQIGFENCPAGTYALNKLGTQVDSQDSNRIITCRGNQYIAMVLESEEPLTKEQSAQIEILPLEFGDTYYWALRNVNISVSEARSQGPKIWQDSVVFSNGLASGRMFSLDADTLQVQWTANIGESSFLHEISATSIPTVIASTLDGLVVALNLNTGEEVWRLDLDGQRANHVIPVISGYDTSVYIMSSPTTSDSLSAPQLRSVNGETGKELWVSDANEGTVWQADWPLVFERQLVLLDAPQQSDQSASLIAFNLDSGDREWTLELQDHSELIDHQRLVRGGGASDSPIIVATGDGDVLAVNNKTGEELWRRSTGYVNILGTWSDTVHITQYGIHRDLDINTGDEIELFDPDPLAGTPASATLQEDGKLATNIELADGSIIALYLFPYSEPNLTLLQSSLDDLQVDGTREVAQLVGQHFRAHIWMGECPANVLRDGQQNQAGSLLDTPNANEVTACRPEQSIYVVIESTSPLRPFDTFMIDLVPVKAGPIYEELLGPIGLSNVLDPDDQRGPMIFDELRVISGGFLSGTVMALDNETGETLWTVDIGNMSFLHGSIDSPIEIVLAANGFKEMLGLSIDSGEELWSLDLGDSYLTTITPRDDSVWFVASSFETDTRAPELRAVDVTTGDVLWQVDGVEGTDWQWSQPVFINDLVVVLDVPQQKNGAASSSLYAYDMSTGELQWSLLLDDATSTPGKQRLATGSRNRLIVTTGDGDVLSVDPSTGIEIWRTRTGVATIERVDGDAVVINVGNGSLLIDAATGELH